MEATVRKDQPTPVYSPITLVMTIPDKELNAFMWCFRPQPRPTTIRTGRH